jgi:DnaJ-class molecular chaperone
VTPALATIALTLLFTLGYAAVCAAQPFARCHKCNGFGFATTTNRRGKTCRRCAGHGIRIRRGRHLWNLWRTTYTRGTVADQPTIPARTFVPKQGDRP